MSEQHVFSVTELNGFIKNVLESVPHLGNVLVRGDLLPLPILCFLFLD